MADDRIEAAQTAATQLAAELGFSGVVRIDVDGESSWSMAFGLADRRHGLANQINTRFSIASGDQGIHRPGRHEPD